MGPMSLGMSLAVHGVAVASIVLAFYSPWSPSEPEEGSRDVIAARLEVIDREILDEPEEERLAELDVPEELVDPFTLDDFEDVFEETVADPFAEIDPPLTFDAPMTPPDLNPENLLEDPELPREKSGPAAARQEEKPSEAVAPAPPARSSAAESDTPTDEDSDRTSDAPSSEALVSPSPIPSECPPPAYPRLAERRGWTGTVVLLIDVAADGTVSDVRIESPSGHDILDEAAVAAVRTWRFRPGTLGGRTAALVVRKPIRFGR
jgi:periplasmic protein TonB